jgi:SPP1 gp7 family putative phage head morphogenesis protein
MALNDRIMDAEVSHAIGLQRYSNGVVNRIIATLNRADADIFAKLTVALERAPASFNAERLEELLKSVRTLNAEAYARVEKQLTKELKDLVAYEASFQQRLFTERIPTQVVAQVGVAAVNVDTVAAAALSRPFQGVLLREALRGLQDDRARAVRNAVRMGVAEQESIQSIVRRIRGSRALGYKDGLMELSRRNAEALVRTAVTHTQNYAKQEFYKANSDLVDKWEFTATLDGRTTITCASLDGKTYPIGEGPMPPRHWNCRSVATPVVKSWRELGIPIDEVAPSTRASMDGQVSEKLNYSDWLRTKPADFQDEVLGAERAKLFRDKKVDIDRFTNDRGRTYTLEELREVDAALFD